MRWLDGITDSMDQNRRVWKEHDGPGARSGEQLLLPGMEEWQVVREVMNAAPGGNGKVS